MVGSAVKVTDCPTQIAVLVAETATAGVVGVATETVIVLDDILVGLAQFALLVNIQVTISPLFNDELE